MKRTEIKTIEGLLTNVCFKQKLCVQRAYRAVKNVLRDEKYWSVQLHGPKCGYELETNDILYFLPIESLSKYCNDLKFDFITDIKRSWNRAGFKFVDVKELSGDVYFNVDFPSLCFRLRYNEQRE